MENNDLNRRVRYALSLDDDDVVDLLRLAAYSGDSGQIAAWRLKEGEEGYQPCPTDALQAMLNGLIIQRRGARDSDDGAPSSSGPKAVVATSRANDTMVNNDVLKQIRIALSLKTDEVHALIQLGGGKLGSSEVNALFRKPTARNYRRCGDQVLRWFLAGLASKRESSLKSGQAI